MKTEMDMNEEKKDLLTSSKNDEKRREETQIERRCVRCGEIITDGGVLFAPEFSAWLCQTCDEVQKKWSIEFHKKQSDEIIISERERRIFRNRHPIIAFVLYGLCFLLILVIVFYILCFFGLFAMP